LLATRELLKSALAAFERNAAPRSSAVHARDVLEVIAGCYVSATTGEQIRLGRDATVRLRDFRMGVPSTVADG
jgi:hypothetical protein